MAYRIEGKDIVISGFEQGIADTPYSGIADMRNMETINIPGEASVQFAQSAVAAPPVLTATAYTAQNTGDTITIASTTGLYVGCAVVLASNTAGGLSNSVVYYVFNIVGNTFQVRLAPASGSAVAVTSDGTGTLSTYQYGNQRGLSAIAPVSYWVDRNGSFAGSNAVLVVDGSNYVWAILSAAQGVVPANSLIFLGNIGGIGAAASTRSGIAIFNGYIILLGSSLPATDYARVSTLWVTGPAAAWGYSWESVDTNSVNGRVGVIVSQEDGNMYWTSTVGLGSLIETPDDTFDPTDTASYSITDTAIALPETDESTCLAELGTNIIIGGRNNFVYVWDKISLGFSTLLNMPDIFTTEIVAASQNAYVFAGNRGRIYITNGSGIDRYKKISDYLTGNPRPYIRWRSATFSKDQLVFSFTATDNSNNELTTTSGIWGIDLENDSLRLINKTTNSGYTGTTNMVVETPPSNSGVAGTSIVGTAFTVGWFSGTTYGVDMGSANPYVNYESYLETDMIPVGTYLDPFTPSQIEWKTSAPLVSGESVRLSYRTNITEAYTTITDATHSTGESTTVGAVSDMFQTNFQKAQWAQFKVETKSTASSPSYVRLTELRVRDWPSGVNNGK